MNYNFLLAVIIMTSSFIIFTVRAINGFLNPYRKMIYKIHPLVLVKKQGMISSGVTLLQQDQLDENELLIGQLNTNQNIVLYCTGYFNCLSMTEKDRINVDEVQIPHDCKRGEILFSKTIFEKYKIYNRSCLSPMLGTISLPAPEKPCASGKGVLVQSGFRIFEKTPIFHFEKNNYVSFLPLYDICFDKNTMSPIYTLHQLVKSKLLYKEVILSDMSMNRISRGLMVVKYDKSSYYSEQLKITFRDTFGPTRGNMLLKMFHDRNKEALLPYRLTPAGDFFYQPIKTATFMYENSIPVFGTICDGNLKIVELLGRILAVQLDRSLIVVTGSFGLLELEDQRGKKQILYLDREYHKPHIFKTFRPVVEHIYKIYYEPLSKRGIVFVTLNNPYVQKDDKIDPPCDNIIDRFMDHDFFLNPNPTAGITVCCQIKNLITKQPDLSYLNDFKFGSGVLSLDVHNENFPIDLFYTLNKRPREKSKFLDNF